MDIDFTRQIKDMKEKDILHKPFPTGGGYALFAKNEEGCFVKVLFSSQEHIKNYLNNLGYDWGNEGKDEYRNFDCLNRLLTVMPELSEVETVAADPQWDPDKAPEETMTKHDSDRKMEDMPDLAVELREVDHSVTPVSNHPAHNEKLQASTTTSKKKLPPWMDKDKKEDKKNDKKGDKKGDKKEDEKGDKKEKGKNGKKLPPWLNKKKSKSKDYSDLYKKVNSNIRGPGQMFAIGDVVEDINPSCQHFGSQGNVVGMRKIAGMHMKGAVAGDHGKHTEEKQDAGYLFAYSTINAGANWNEGDVLEKTGDQLKKLDQTSAPCGPGGCFY